MSSKLTGMSQGKMTSRGRGSSLTNRLWNSAGITNTALFTWSPWVLEGSVFRNQGIIYLGGVKFCLHFPSPRIELERFLQL